MDALKLLSPVGNRRFRLFAGLKGTVCSGLRLRRPGSPEFKIFAARGNLLLKILCLLLASRLFLPPLRAADQPLEYQVKAAFLLKFTGFIEWPAGQNSNAPFSLCVLGDDPFGHVLDQLVEGENVSGHRILVRRIRREAPGTCSLIYVSSQEKNLREILAAAGPGVLTVGEGDNFLDDGGMIAFVIDNRRVRFDIDPGSARKAGLKISSRLLNVARIVR